MIHAMKFFAYAWLDRVSLVCVRLVQVQYLFAPARGHRQRFARQHFDRRHAPTDHRRDANRRFSVTVIVVLQVFEYVADVQEGIPIQTDVHECGLHARQDSRYFSFVDAADERKFFLALNVDFD
jgi:hypothetical protein